MLDVEFFVNSLFCSLLENVIPLPSGLHGFRYEISFLIIEDPFNIMNCSSRCFQNSHCIWLLAV